MGLVARRSPVLVSTEASPRRHGCRPKGVEGGAVGRTRTAAFCGESTSCRECGINRSTVVIDRWARAPLDRRMTLQAREKTTLDVRREDDTISPVAPAVSPAIELARKA